MVSLILVEARVPFGFLREVEVLAVEASVEVASVEAVALEASAVEASAAEELQVVGRHLKDSPSGNGKWCYV